MRGPFRLQHIQILRAFQANLRAFRAIWVGCLLLGLAALIYLLFGSALAEKADETVLVPATLPPGEPVPEFRPGPMVGDAAPDICLTALESRRTVTLNELLYRERPVVLIFGSFS